MKGITEAVGSTSSLKDSINFEAFRTYLLGVFQQLLTKFLTKINDCYEISYENRPNGERAIMNMS